MYQPTKRYVTEKEPAVISTKFSVTEMRKLYVTEKELAEISSFKVQTLRNWRHKRIGPPYVKVNNRAIRYHLDSALQYFNSGCIDPEKID